jgi:hypothetical protein
MALCDILIDANIQASCENPMFGGYEQLGWIINKSDVATTTIEEGVVSAISLKVAQKHTKSNQQVNNLLRQHKPLSKVISQTNGTML